MNERIVKLITEASCYADTVAEKYVPECGEVNYLWEDAFRKKFAELIVRDCIAIIEGYCETSPEIYGLPLEVMDHFGIDEIEE